MAALTSLFGDDADILREDRFQLLLLASILPVLGTSLISPVLDSLVSPLGTTPANIGLMISFFTAPPILMIPIAGVLADRYGRKPVLISSLLVFGLAGTAIPLTTDFETVLGLRLLQGIGFGGTNPIIIASIGDLYAGSREATGQGLRFMTSGFSGTLFPLVSGLLVVIGWQYPFLLYAAAVPIALVVFLFYDEPASTRLASGESDHQADSYVRSLYRLVRHRRVLAMVAARALPMIVWIGFLTYNSLVVVRLMGGTPPEAGLLTAVGSFAFALVGSQAGRVAARYDSWLFPLVVANLCLIVGFVLLLFAGVLPIAIVATAIIGTGIGMTLSLYRSVLTALAPAGLRAGLVSLAEATGRFVTTLTPIVMGGVIALATPEIGFAAAIQIAGVGMAVVSGVGGVVCLLVAREALSNSVEPVEVS